jgi:uncharacterized protein YfaS (alpha-2-macroglobulin family)
MNAIVTFVRRSPRRSFLTLFIFVLALGAGEAQDRPAAQPPRGSFDSFEELKAAAEKFYSEKSFARALALYEQTSAMELSEEESRWVEFRLGDTLWRNQAATQTHDDTIYQRAVSKLHDVLAEFKVATDRDRLWAMTQESLGDFYWERDWSRDFGNGWNHYSQALDYWAGSRDLEVAGAEYLRIIFEASEPAWLRDYEWYRQYIQIPANILENAVRIADDPNDLAHARYLLAMAMRQQGGGWRQQQRIEDLFKQLIAPGKSHDWYDDGLFYYAEWLSQQGRPTRSGPGTWAFVPQYREAVELYRRITGEFRRGETQYYDNAQQRIREITSPSVSVSVGSAFLPGSVVQFNLNWRNVEDISLALYPVNLAADVRFPQSHPEDIAWYYQIDLRQKEAIQSWNKDTQDAGDHVPGYEVISLEDSPPAGAYILEAKSGGLAVRELLLVSDATIVLKSVAGEALVYFCDALDGSPIAEADIALWDVRHLGDERWEVIRHESTTDESGLAHIDLKRSQTWGNLYAFASLNGRQAFAQHHSSAAPGESQEYRIYAFTDRPAYRPGDTVEWKSIARLYRDSKYQTPANQNVTYVINDPQGSKIKEGDLTLNAFGSAADSVALTETMALGQYTIEFRTPDNGWIGSATLFRLEEYKLPEFEVVVKPPMNDDGTPKALQLGDIVEAEIQADYYFGAPVANADVEVVVRQKNFWFWWQPMKDYAWLYQEQNPYQWYGWDYGQEIKREQIKTDETGKAVISFETPMNVEQDFEYVIEARVVDSSRREITDSGTVRVTRQKYYVYPEPKHNIYRPGETVTVKFRGLDANTNPVKAVGKVHVYRDEWKEIWVSPDGRELTGNELAAERSRHRIFPPTPSPGEMGWRLKFRGYTSEEILSTTVETDEKGEGTLEFEPPRDGYYRITWLSESEDLYPITAQTYVWVCTEATRAVGYYHGGVDIIVDQDTFKSGQTAPVMISVPTNNRYVLFTIEGNDLHSYQVLHIEGTAKLVNVEVKEEHEPNIWLTASMVHEGQMYGDSAEVIVPPVKHFLDIAVDLDRDSYEPGQTGTLNVKVTDNDGNPVSAEVALAVLDESVYYIQQDLAGDPRPFFFSDRQYQQVATSSMFNHRALVKLVKDEDDKVIQVPITLAEREARAAAHGDDSGLLDASGEVEGYFQADRMEFAARDAAPMAPASAANAPGGMGGGGGGMRARGGQALDEQAQFLGMENKSLGRLQQGQAPAEGGEGQPDEPAVRVRSDFRATALWEPMVVTNESGEATVEVKFPDSTSRWKAIARGDTTGSAFGIGDATVQTRQPLIVRLQAPRFFVVGDYTTVSGVFNNNTDEPMQVRYDLVAEGLDITSVEINGPGAIEGDDKIVEVPANSSTSVDWKVAVNQAGMAKVTVIGRAGQHTDGMERTYTVYDHGIEKHLIRSGKVRGDDVTITVDLPPRREGSTSMTVQVTPSIAITMLDALPYLIDYPYGCTEQTMSRFLPAAIAAKTLKDLGVDPAVAMSRVFGGIEEEFIDDTHPQGERDLSELNAIVEASLRRLYDFQHGDGGWGWWKEGDSDRFMSAYIIWGLSLAKEAGYEIDANVLARGVEYLRANLVEAENQRDLQAWMLHALASYQHALDDNAVSEFERTALENIWSQRERLNAYSRALLALSMHYYGDAERAQVLVRNLENGVKLDETPDTSVLIGDAQEHHEAVMATAHWGEDRIWYRWSDGGVESTSFVLRALVAIEPDHHLIEPVMNWLVKNRRGAQWSNTRDTAITVLAMNDYLRASGELQPEMSYELLVNGQSIAEKDLNADDIFTAPSVFTIDPALLKDGENEVRIVRSAGETPIYFMTDAQFFSEEEPITPAGNEIFVRRDYYKLVPYPTLLKGYNYDRVPMKDGDSVESGERIEVVLTIETKNNYEYLVFEDLKPAGLEAVSVQSGQPLYATEIKQAGIERRFEDASGTDAQDVERDPSDYTGRQQWAYQELRDRHIAMFFSSLPQGVWEATYELRAEVPGEFHALPVLGHAMYVPEIRCNSAEMRMTVYDRE